jgi:hypothetical protein
MSCSQQFAYISEEHTASIFRDKYKPRTVTNKKQQVESRTLKKNGDNIFLMIAISLLIITVIGLSADPKNEAVNNSEISGNFCLHGVTFTIYKLVCNFPFTVSMGSVICSLNWCI